MDPSTIAAAGYQAKDFKRLASALQKEFTGGGSSGGGSKSSSKQTPWQKLSIGSPTELYDTETVPLPESVRRGIEDLLPKYQNISNNTLAATQNASKALREWSKLNDESERGTNVPKNVPAEAYQWYPDEYFSKPKIKKSDSKYQKSSENVRQAQAEETAFKVEQSMQADVLNAMKQGVLAAYQKQGRTPAKDQMANVLNFLAKTGK
jgi:hypothetical protein